VDSSHIIPHYLFFVLSQFFENSLKTYASFGVNLDGRNIHQDVRSSTASVGQILAYVEYLFIKRQG